MHEITHNLPVTLSFSV